ncbi:MAG: PASTA domain-containing protein [Candidatus Aquicultorales bacterium]
MEGKIFQERYRLLERIGSGGMADVYKAEDTVLSRTVALKVLYRSLADDPDFVERFRREARAAASLSHPNIVAIYDWGAEDSTYFIVMEYIEGETLKDKIRRDGALPQPEVVQTIKAVATALGYAHRKGVVHRDIKPHNIMITRENEIKVTDFGIARAGSSSITQTGTILGTAHYISPEQAKGQDVGPPSDIYSLGIVMFETLTGKLPFEGENPVSVALKQIEEKPRMPSLLNREITVDLENVVMKCLAKDELLRYATAEELRDDLSRIESGMPVTAPPAETTMVIPQPFEPQEPKGRWKKVLLSSLVALLLLGAAFGAGFALFDMTKPPEEKATVPRLIGLTADQAKVLLKNRKLQLKKSGEEYSETVESGQIIRHTPPESSELKPGSVVSVVLSKGKPLVTVPNVIGETSDNATSKMMKTGLDPSGNNVYEYSDKIAVGRVIGQQPEPGQSVRKGTPFTLTISKGPETVQVPDVVNKGIDEAAATLEQAGLKVTQTDEFSDSVGSGLVIRTAPPAGTKVDMGSTVAVVVSKGPDMVTIPTLIGETEASAKSLLQQAGLEATVTYVPGTTQPGKVVGSSPAAGTKVKRNSPVAIYVGQTEPPPED